MFAYRNKSNVKFTKFRADSIADRQLRKRSAFFTFSKDTVLKKEELAKILKS